MMPRTLSPILVAMALGTSYVVAQVPATAPTQTAPSAQTATAEPAPEAGTMTDALTPAVSQLQGALGVLHVDKWKIAGPARDESMTNLGSIRRDLENTLPPLLTAADATPNSVSSLLPVFRNVNALYDVVLRVTLVAQMSAPQPQSSALSDALHALEDARRKIGDKLQSNAMGEEQEITRLKTVTRPPAPVAPVVAAPVPAPAAVAPKPKKKPKPKPVAPAAPAASNP